MSLRDELGEWIAEYPALKDHGWTEPELEALGEALWDFLSEKIGPVQEKLLADVELARQRADQAERNELRAVESLERYIRDHSSD